MSYGYGRRRRRYGWSSGDDSKCRQPEDRPDVARRLVSIITAQKRGHARPEYGRRSGRVDTRNLHRAAAGDPRVFSRPGAASPTRLRLVLLLDLSGSTYGTVASNIAQMGWDLISAGTQVPSVNVEVWGHTTGSLLSGDTIDPTATACREGAFIKLVELWKPGTSRWQFWMNVRANDFKGNEDGWALKVLADDVRKRIDHNERALYVVISDGQPVYNEMDKAEGHVRGVVNDIRRHGGAVVSVSASSSLLKVSQGSMYGDDAVIAYDYNTGRLIQNIARAIGKALN